MKLHVGQIMDEQSGIVKDRYLLFGRVVKDSELKVVGQKGTKMLRFPVSPGRDEDLCNVIMWGYDAQEYSNIRKGSIVLLDVVETMRQYNGREYRDYTSMNAIAIKTAAVDRGSEQAKLNAAAADAFSEIDGSIF